MSVKVYASLDNTLLKTGCCKVTAFFNQRIYLVAGLELCKVHMIKTHLFECHSKVGLMGSILKFCMCGFLKNVFSDLN